MPEAAKTRESLKDMGIAPLNSATEPRYYEMSLEAIAEAEGCSKQRIDQLLRGAMLKFVIIWRMHGLKLEDYVTVVRRPGV